MPSSRIFVSYACVGDERGSTIGRQLVRDIRATGTEAVADHETISDEQFMPFIHKELPQCGYLIFIQTPAALRSLRVQSTVTLALTLVEQKRMRAVIRVIAAPTAGMEGQPLLTALRTFDASVDYPRARDQLLLNLGLITLNGDDSFAISSPLPPSKAPQPTRNPAPPITSGPIPSGPITAPPRSGPVSIPGNSGPFIAPSGPIPGGSLPPAPPGPAFPPAPLNAQQVSSGILPNYAPPAVPARGSQFSAPAPVPGKGRSKLQALFARPLKTMQTSVKSVDAAQTLLVDRPLPIKTTRRTIIRVVGTIGLLVLLALVVFLVIFLIHQHGASFSPHRPTPTPHRVTVTPTPHRPAR